MTQELGRMISNWSLNKKLIAIVIISIALLAATAMAGQTVILNRYNGLLYDSVSDYLLVSTGRIEDMLSSLADLSSYVMTNSALQGNLEDYLRIEFGTERSGAYQSLYTALIQYSAQNKYINYIGILGKGGEEWLVRSDQRALRVPDPQWIEEAAGAALGGAVWLNPGDGEGVVCARTIRKVKNLSLETLGTLVVHVNLKAIVEDTNQFVYPKSSTLVVMSGDTLIFPYERGEYPVPNLTAARPDRRYEIMNLNGEQQFVVQSKEGRYGWVYSVITPYNEIFDRIIFSRGLFALALLLSVAGAILIAGLLTNNINRHFVTLTKKMRSFQSGNLQPVDIRYDYSWRQDELGMIHRQFDQMLLDISKLIEDSYVKRLLIKDAQIKNLEQQINPHFLYNTLDAIYWHAKQANEPAISEIAQALGALLRGSLSEQADMIPLRRELEFVGNYVKIQKIRYAERMDFSCDVDPKLLEMPIPKMSIQPLIENAVKYSLEAVVENCRLRVMAKADGGTAVISVWNTGSEIDENLLERLKRKEVTPRGSGIGLLNIDKRIQLIFGQKYGLSFRNTEEYAVVEMRLPYAADKGGG